MIEPGTDFHAQWRRGMLQQMDQDDSAELLQLTWDWLQAEGLIAYETSNFARPGAECSHN